MVNPRRNTPFIKGHNEARPLESDAMRRDRSRCLYCCTVYLIALITLAGSVLHWAAVVDLPLPYANTKEVRLYSVGLPQGLQVPDEEDLALLKAEDGDGDADDPGSSKHLKGCSYKQLLKERPASAAGPFPWIHEVMRSESSVMFSFENRGPLSPFSYQVKHYACDADRGYTADTVVCKLTSHHFPVKSISHPAHFFQAITPCWSAFMAFPTARRKIASDNLITRAQMWASSWATELLGAMNAEVIGPSLLMGLTRGSCDRIVVMSPPLAGSGWRVDNHYNLPFVRKSDAVSFRDLMIKGRVKETAYNKPVLRLGILNRGGSRELVHTDRLIGSIRENKNYACIEVAETHNLGKMSPQEQARWVFSKDVIISPHGQQLISLAFMNTCAVVLEIYPRNYLIPGFFLPFAVSLDAVAFGMHNGPGMLQNKTFFRTGELREKARGVKIDAISDIERALPLLLQARERCCRRLRAISMSKAEQARCL